jgi:hypothetical protein
MIILSSSVKFFKPIMYVYKISSIGFTDYKTVTIYTRHAYLDVNQLRWMDYS